MKRSIACRLMCIALICVMLAGTVVGCRTPETPQVSKKKTITIATPTNASITDFNDNYLTKFIEDALDVNIEFITPSNSSDFVKKMNVMFASGEQMPDIIFKIDDKQASAWAAQGLLCELTDFYNDPEISPNITKASEISGINIATMMANADGEIYSLPRWDQSESAQVFKKLWVYKPWLDAMGLDVPETAEEFYEACKKVTEMDLNGNGKQDEVAIWGAGWKGNYSGWVGGLMSPFVYAYDDSYLFVEDGKVDFAFATESWKEGLKYAKSLYQIGALPSELITNSSEQHDALLYRDEVMAFSFWGYGYGGANLEIGSGYVCIPGLTDAQGENGYSHYAPSKPTSAAVITADCTDPELAFKVADFMCSELASLIGRFGIQGEHWDYYENLKDVLPDWEKYTTSEGKTPFLVYNLNVIKDPTSKDQWDASALQNHSYRQAGPFIRLAYTSEFGNNNEAMNPLMLQNNKRRSEAVQACLANKPAQTYDHGPLTTDETDDSAEALSAILKYVREMYAAFIKGDKDIDAEWDTYMNELKNIGLEDLRELYQTAYDRVH